MTQRRQGVVVSARVYERAMAGSFVGFFVCLFALVAAIMARVSWEIDAGLLVLAVGSLVGSGVSKEIAMEIRRHADLAEAPPVEMPDADLWEGRS